MSDITFFCERSEQYQLSLLTFPFSFSVIFAYREIPIGDSVLRSRAKDFAKEIVFLCRETKQTHRESMLANQLLRSGTSIGANIHEARYAQSKPDFISKMEIALKECYETEYWTELLFETGYMEEEKYSLMQNTAGAIRRMLSASCKTAKENRDIRENIADYNGEF